MKAGKQLFELKCMRYVAGHYTSDEPRSGVRSREQALVNQLPTRFALLDTGFGDPTAPTPFTDALRQRGTIHFLVVGAFCEMNAGLHALFRAVGEAAARRAAARTGRNPDELHALRATCSWHAKRATAMTAHRASARLLLERVDAMIAPSRSTHRPPPAPGHSFAQRATAAAGRTYDGRGPKRAPGRADGEGPARRRRR